MAQAGVHARAVARKPVSQLHGLNLSFPPALFNLFIYLPHCMACGILVPQPVIEPGPSEVKARSLNHWATREFPHPALEASKLSASPQLVFSKNCSTYRWIFYVFVGGGEFRVLLLCHLHSYSTNSLILFIFYFMSSDCEPTREFCELWHKKVINITMHLANNNNYEALTFCQTLC